MPTVKVSKPTRSQRAIETRARMREAAYAEFAARGYAATTMKEIAERAGVAVQTLYYTFRTKGLLLREVMESATGGGAGSGPISDRPWLREIMSSTDPQRMLALSAELGGSVYERAAPLWPVIQAAALSDPEVEQYWREVADARRSGMGRVVVKIATAGALKPGLSPERAADVLYSLASHDTFQNLVIDAKWPVNEYKAWLFWTLVQQLLGAVELDRDAVAGLDWAPRAG